MAEPFATQSWIDALWAELRSDETFRAAGASWVHGPLLLVIQADPEKGFAETVAIRMDLHQGETRDLRLVPAHGARITPFVLTGPFARWKNVLSAATDAYEAILQGRLRLKGDLPVLARHRSLLGALASCAARVPTNWQDDAAAPAPAGAAR